MFAGVVHKRSSKMDKTFECFSCCGFQHGYTVFNLWFAGEIDCLFHFMAVYYSELWCDSAKNNAEWVAVKRVHVLR